ncbi:MULTISPECIES: hypothetical protein [unclassified Rhizobium]|uniref:hypothetical protein n=1 Tax=unclassified Rhizobium TaxID=2613769 RepID=UPI003803D19A
MTKPIALIGSGYLSTLSELGDLGRRLAPSDDDDANERAVAWNPTNSTVLVAR